MQKDKNGCMIPILKHEALREVTGYGYSILLRQKKSLIEVGKGLYLVINKLGDVNYRVQKSESAHLVTVHVDI